jgi:hypothetical protein
VLVSGGSRRRAFQGAKWLDGTDTKNAGSFKLFTEPKLREVVLNRLTAQFASIGLCRSEPTVRLCLACGKIRARARKALADHFAKNDWQLFDEKWLRGRLQAMVEGGYENQVSAVVAKLILRGVVD